MVSGRSCSSDKAGVTDRDLTGDRTSWRESRLFSAAAREASSPSVHPDGNRVAFLLATHEEHLQLFRGLVGRK